MSYYDHDGSCDDYCEDCYDNGYDDGWDWDCSPRSSRSSSNGGDSNGYYGGGGSSEGCYIATAVYGSYDCPEVWTLRRFRDLCLKQCCVGRGFVWVYYAVSPSLVRWFGQSTWFRRLWESPLNALVARLQREGYEDTPYGGR